MNKRKILKLFLCFAVAFVFIFSSCNKLKKEEYIIPHYNGFSVHFLDVGEGNCTFIRFPDGKNLLFDCGQDLKRVYKTVKNALNSYKVKTIDYLILSHPDGEHIGNTENIIEDFNVKTVYIPKVKDYSLYPTLRAVNSKIDKEKIKISEEYEYVLGEDYCFAFLSPDKEGDIYAEFNSSVTPTEKQLNDVSPLIYIEYKGVRFLLTADATEDVEKMLVDSYNSSVLPLIYNKYGVTVNLSEIDFYLVSGHGSTSSNSNKFLNLIKPKNSVISVGGDNLYGHPNSNLLTLLLSVKEDMNIYRTDYFGTVSVLVDTSGKYTVKVESNV